MKQSLDVEVASKRHVKQQHRNDEFGDFITSCVADLNE